MFLLSAYFYRRRYWTLRGAVTFTHVVAAERLAHAYVRLAQE